MLSRSPTLLPTALLSLLLASVLTGCGGEVERLEAENRALVDSVQQLNRQIAQLQDAPGYHYAQAQEMLEAGELADAKAAFAEIVRRYPDSPEAEHAAEGLETAESRIEEREAEAARRAREAEARRQEQAAAERRRRAEIERSITTRRDEVENITWHYAGNSRDWTNYGFYAYVGERAGNHWLRFFMGTRTPDWLFWEDVVANVDGRRYELPVQRFEKETDTRYRGVQEWLDQSVDRSLQTTLRRIAEGDNVTLRFRGSAYYRDYTLAESDKRNLGIILDYYEEVR